MASTYSTNLRTELIGSGDQAGTWGSTTNTSLGSILEQAIAGVSGGPYVSGTYPTVNFPTDADLTLTANNGAVDQSRNAVLVVTSTGSLTATRNVIAPSSASKVYIIKNSTTGGQSIQIKYSSGTGVTIGNGLTALVYGDGTNFYLVTNPNSVTGNLTVSGNATVGGTLGVTGAQTNSSTLQATTITATTQFSGPGTGLTGTAASLSIAGANVTGTVANATNAVNATNATSATSATNITASSNSTLTSLPSLTSASSLNTVGTISSGTWSGSFGAVSGANLTNITGANVTGTVPTATNAVNATNPASGGSFITSSNIGSQSVNYATSAGSATNGLTTLNYNSYTPTLTGGNASGSWGINVTGSSASCSGNSATATTAASCSGNSATATTANALNSGNSYSVVNLTASGYLYASGNVTAYSDERLKSDITTLTNALDTVQALRGTAFVKDGVANIGLIAQEVQKVLPQVVHETPDGYLSVAYGNIVGVLIEAVKELKAEVEELKRGK